MKRNDVKIIYSYFLNKEVPSKDVSYFLRNKKFKKKCLAEYNVLEQLTKEKVILEQIKDKGDLSEIDGSLSIPCLDSYIDVLHRTLEKIKDLETKFDNLNNVIEDPFLNIQKIKAIKTLERFFIMKEMYPEYEIEFERKYLQFSIEEISAYITSVMNDNYWDLKNLKELKILNQDIFYKALNNVKLKNVLFYSNGCKLNAMLMYLEIDQNKANKFLTYCLNKLIINNDEIFYLKNLYKNALMNINEKLFLIEVDKLAEIEKDNLKKKGFYFIEKLETSKEKKILSSYFLKKTIKMLNSNYNDKKPYIENYYKYLLTDDTSFDFIVELGKYHYSSDLENNGICCQFELISNESLITDIVDDNGFITKDWKLKIFNSYVERLKSNLF